MTVPSDLPSVSVVVPTHGRPVQVAGLVSELLQQDDCCQVVVAVDGPDPQLQDLLSQQHDDRLLVVVLPSNVGQAAAREAGARAASGDLVLLLDDDVRLEPGAIRGHAQRHSGEPGLVVVGHNPVALPERRRAGMAATYLYAAEYDRAWTDLLEDQALVLDRLWGGHISLGRDAYLQASGHVWPVRYHEDQDLGRRLKAAGLTGRADPSLRSRHHHVRALHQSVEEARRQGQALAVLAARWPESAPPAYATRPGPLGLLRLISGPRVGDAVVGLALVLARAAGAVRAWSVETAALRVARQIELRRALRASLEPQLSRAVRPAG